MYLYQCTCSLAVVLYIQDGLLIYKPSVYSQLSLSEFSAIFKSCNGTTLPLIAERYYNLQEAASVLREVTGSRLINYNNYYRSVKATLH